MRYSVLIFFILVFGSLQSQNWHPCSFTINPVETFPPNSVSSSTYSGFQYLCGPNTVVFDTSSTNFSGVFAFLNPGTVLNLKMQTPAYHYIAIKNTATLNILPGTSNPVVITYEPGAVINNIAGVSLDSAACVSVSMNPVNCSITEVREFKPDQEILIFPNPSSGLITIANQPGVFFEVFISDAYGRVLLTGTDGQGTLNIEGLSAGVYYLHFHSNEIAYTRKLIRTSK